MSMRILRFAVVEGTSKWDLVESKSQFSQSPDDKNDAHNEKYEAHDTESDHLEDSVILVRGSVACQQRSL